MQIPPKLVPVQTAEPNHPTAGSITSSKSSSDSKISAATQPIMSPRRSSLPQSPFIALAKFAHDNLSTSSSSAPSSSSSTFSAKVKKKDKNSKRKSTSPKGRHDSILSPRSPRSTGEGIIHTVHNTLLQESIAKTLELSKAKVRNGPYGLISLQEIEQTVELFYHQNIRELLTRANLVEAQIPIETILEKHPDLFARLRNSIEAEDFPLILLCLMPLKGYATALPDTCSFFRELKKVIAALVTLDVTRFEDLARLDSAKPLEKIIALLSKYSKTRIGETLSKLILGSAENQIDKLLKLLEKWNNIDDQAMMIEMDKIRHNPLYRHMPSIEHDFKMEDIVRTLFQDGNVLPHTIMINYLPLKLTGYEGDNQKKQFDFFHNLISQIHFAGLSPHILDDEIQTIVNDLIDDDAFPTHLNTLLGLSTISSKIQAFEFFLSHFSSPFREHGMICRQKKGQPVQLFFNLKSLPMNCYQPMVLVLYPKLSPDPKSFAIDTARPLAEITIAWTGYLFRSEVQSSYYTHSETLEIQKCDFLGANDAEQEFIIQTLGISSPIKKVGKPRSFPIPTLDLSKIRAASSSQVDPDV